MTVNQYDPIADLYDIHVPVTFDLDFFLKEVGKAGGEVLELLKIAPKKHTVYEVKAPIIIIIIDTGLC